MSFTYYSLNITYAASNVFSGWIQVNNSNTITQVWDNSTSSNCLQSTIQPGFPWPGGPTADNIYPLTVHGFFFLSNNIQTVYGNSVSNIFNIDDFEDTGGITMFASNGDNVTNNIAFASIPDPTCFNEGTKILTLNTNFVEEYKAIESLKKGDLVKTYKHGYQKIELIGKNILINNTNDFKSCMYKMIKNDTNCLTEDLIVTGGHSILVDTLSEEEELNNTKLFRGNKPKLEDKFLLLAATSSSFHKIENSNSFTYYHFVLENNGDANTRYGIWANGILTESTTKTNFLSKQLL